MTSDPVKNLEMTLKSLDARISKNSQGHKVTGVSKKCLFVMIRGIFADYTSRKRTTP